MTDAPKARGPILIELDGQKPAAEPSAAPPVPDLGPQERRAAMQQVAALAARRPSRLAKWFWSLLVAILGFVVSLATWNYVTGLIQSVPILGMIATALVGAFCIVLLIIAIKELAAFNRLARMDGVHKAAQAAVASGQLSEARAVIDRIDTLYSGRDDTAWGRAQVKDRKGDVLDADALLGLAETSILAPLDQQAMREVEAAARQVATVTAIVPLALADVFTALTSNLRMIRRIAEIYGGRSGTFGSWRLTRTVLSHLVATGAVAVGDDLIGSVAGGGVLAKLSRRFGEGVINGALTARVGVAAMEVCRPMPFIVQPRPSVTALVLRSLTGLFGSVKE